MDTEFNNFTRIVKFQIYGFASYFLSIWSYLLALNDCNFKQLTDNYVEVAMFDLPTSGYLRANTIMKDLIRIATQNELLNVSGVQARKSNENFEFGIWEIGFQFYIFS